MKEVVKYSVVDAEINKWRDIYMHLTIDDLDDKEQFDAVHSARMVVKNKRVEIEKERKSLKADALAWGKLVDTKAKEIFAKLEPIESHLAKEEQKVVDEQNRIKAEEEARQEAIIQKRVDDLLAVECVMPFIQVATLTDDEFQCLLGDKTFEFEERQKAKAEVERLKKERLEKEATERKAEDERLAKQKAEQDKIAADLKRQQDELAAQTKALQDEKDRIAKEASDKQAAENARLKAELEAKEKAEREAKEKAEAEEKARVEAERQESLKPDKEKLIDWIRGYGTNPIPEIETPEVAEILKVGLEYIQETLHRMLRQVEEL